ncbi:hypothetical protein Ga0100231_023140 [Opitutaceae bacterium TAV4]|nr:hypothetical protein Ga0100231_023140 [Opitutaceae bacterium TAV4]
MDASEVPHALVFQTGVNGAAVFDRRLPVYFTDVTRTFAKERRSPGRRTRRNAPRLMQFSIQTSDASRRPAAWRPPLLASAA